jgi:hypothetical protein
VVAALRQRAASLSTELAPASEHDMPSAEDVLELIANQKFPLPMQIPG